MAAVTAVRSSDDVPGARAPGGDDPVDGGRGEVGAVGQDDDSRLSVLGERAQAALQRGPWTALPVGALDDARRYLEGMRAGHDDDLLDGACLERVQHGREKKLLLRRPEARGRSRSENDRADYRQPFSRRHSAVTLAT